MKSKLIQYTIVILGLSLSACSPSKEVMCEKIADYRSNLSTDTKEEVAERYIRCLNAPDDYANKMYKEIMASEERK
jgi:hypothetical protein